MALTGSRIRELRLARAVRQADLARSVGVSASYLNLIEHNKRRIAGKLLLDLARELGVEAEQLSQGVDAGLLGQLRGAARLGQGAEPLPEEARLEEFVGRFPGWAGLVGEQAGRIAALEAQLEASRDRLAHDPVLADAMHEVLSTVAAIRSTSDILVRESELDPNWRARFHRNLHEEAERLSRRATGMLGHFERQGQEAGPGEVPEELVEALFEAHGFHFAGIEARGKAAIEELLSGISGGSERELAESELQRYAADAERLPLARFGAAAAEAGYDPEALLALGGGDAALVLRRLASLPREGHAGLPEFGLAVCDGAGALVFRRRAGAFSIPRFGAGCAHWPLYRALARPMQPISGLIELHGGVLYRAWAVSQPVVRAGFDREALLQSTMLVRVATPEEEAAMTRPDHGPGCQHCQRLGQTG